MVYLLFGIAFGLLAGFLIAYFFVSSKSAQKTNTLQKEHKSALQLATSAKETATEKAIKQEAELESAKKNLSEKLNDINRLNAKIEELASDLNTWKTNANIAKSKLESQKEEISNLNEKFTKEFQLIASKILDEKTEKFTSKNKTDLREILDPFNEKIKDFSSKVEETYVKGTKERSMLHEQIKHLTDLNNRMESEARNLTNALKQDTKAQGNWGEMILERILDNSGLVKGHEYESQYHSRNDEGSSVRPDVVIKLPENKHVIIDSKVSLTAYEAFVNAENDEERGRQLKNHMDSVKSHIKLLAEKNYHNAKGIQSPDFVLMFIPIESSFSAAVQTDKSIFNFAWDRKIVIVSPSTLLATLRTISAIWKQEKQNKNALEIAKQAGLLYDKFVGFLADMAKIEKSIKSLDDTYLSAMNKLKTGKGNLITKSEQLRTLGAKSTKKLPEQFNLGPEADE